MEKQDLLLIFPIGWDPTYPYLALPVLKGYLKTKGIEAQIYDDNAKFFHTILTKRFFETVKKQKKHWEMKDEYLNPFYEKVEYYKRILQGKEDNKSYEVYQVAANVINNILNFYGRVFHLKIGLQNIECEDYSIGLETILKQMLDRSSILGNYMQMDASIFDEMKNKEKIGFSITGRFQLVTALYYSRFLRGEGYKGLLFLGGNYISRIANHKEKILNQILEDVDCIILYDGEEIVEKIARNIPMEQIPNIIFKRGSDIVINQYKNVGKDEAICPDFDGFPMSEYMLPELILPLYTSVNCYNNCFFCNISGFQDKNYRQLELLNVTKNIERLKQKYGTNIFYFVDQTFSISRMIQFAKILIDQKISIMWLCETRIDRVLCKDEIEILKKSGCIKLQIGLESYNQRILDLMNKNVKLEDIEESVQNLNDRKLAFHLFCMYGYPGESFKETKNTLSYIHSMEIKCINCGNEYYSYGLSKFQLEKGSYISAHPQEFGLILLEENPFDLSLILHYENEVDELAAAHLYDKCFELIEASNIDALELICLKHGIKKVRNERKKYEIKMIYVNEIEYEIAWDKFKNEFIWRQTTWENTFQDFWIAYHNIEEIQVKEKNYRVFANKRFACLQQENHKIVFCDQYSKGFVRGNLYAMLLWAQCKRGNYIRKLCEENYNIPNVDELIHKMIKSKLLIIAFHEETG